MVLSREPGSAKERPTAKYMRLRTRSFSFFPTFFSTKGRGHGGDDTPLALRAHRSSGSCRTRAGCYCDCVGAKARAVARKTAVEAGACASAGWAKRCECPTSFVLAFLHCSLIRDTAAEVGVMLCNTGGGGGDGVCVCVCVCVYFRLLACMRRR